MVKARRPGHGSGRARYPARMGLDFSTVATNMPTAVPMVGTLNIEFLELDPQRAVLRMPDQAAYHNHIGGIHAGAMFTLAETASGALVLGHFGDRLGEVTPLAVEATIRYLRIAMGPMTAIATMDVTADEVIAVMNTGRRPEFTINISLQDDSGTETGAMSILWTLKRNRKP